MHASTPIVTVYDAPPVDEDDGTVTFTVTRTGNTAQKLTVDYMTVDGTAKAGDDYALTSGTLKFAAGDTTKTVTVPIIKDDVYEEDETFSLKLSSPSKTAWITDPEGQGTIKNDDAHPPVIHQDDNLTSSTLLMRGQYGVQDLFVFNSDYNKNYAPLSDDFAAIFEFTPGEDKIVVIDSDGAFAEKNITHTPHEECLALGGDYDCQLSQSYFEYIEAQPSDSSGGNKVWAVVYGALITWDDIVVTTPTDPDYSGLTWA